MKTSEYLFQEGLDFFHIIARYKSNIMIFICSEQGEQHLGHPQKHMFWRIKGEVWGSKHMKGEAVWEVSKFGKLSNYMLLLLYLTVFYMYLSKTLISFELLHGKF